MQRGTHGAGSFRNVYGRSNREIASQLYIAQKTVEKHLASAFQKLGISSRTQLVYPPVTSRRNSAIRVGAPRYELRAVPTLQAFAEAIAAIP